MGLIDRIVRAIVAITVIILYATDTISGIGAIIALVLAGVFLITGSIGFCPIYAPFRFSTKSKGNKVHAGNNTER